MKHFSLSGHLLSSERSTSPLYQTITPPTDVTSSWNHGGKSSLVSGPMADLWTSTWPQVQNPNNRNQSLPLKTAGIFVCVCVCARDCQTCACMCLWSICLMKYLKISDPLRTLCLLLGLCVRAWVKRKLYVCRCAWQVSAGPVCETFYLSLCVWLVNECLTVDAHYKILHVFIPGQAVTHKCKCFLFILLCNMWPEWKNFSESLM